MRDHSQPGSSHQQAGKPGVKLGSHTCGATHGSGKTGALAVPMGEQKFDMEGLFHLAGNRKNTRQSCWPTEMCGTGKQHILYRGGNELLELLIKALAGSVLTVRTGAPGLYYERFSSIYE